MSDIKVHSEARQRTVSACAIALVAVLCASAATFAVDSVQRLPVTVRVVSYDATLDAILLSGDLSNSLPRTLQAVRGTMTLNRNDGGQPMEFAFSHQLRRALRPGEYAVWSVWIDVDANVPEHAVLKDASAADLTPALRVHRVLYADGSQEEFAR